MHDKHLQNERAWMTLYLSSCGMSEFDRVNARAMLVRGVAIGDLLARCWQRIRGA